MKRSSFAGSLDQSQHPFTNSYYESRSPKLFLPEDRESEVYIMVDKHRSMSKATDDLSNPATKIKRKHTTGSSANFSILQSPYILYSIADDAEDLVQQLTESKQDLKIVHIRQAHSYSALSVTKSCFERLLTYARIFPAFKDTILNFGRREVEIEVAPPRPRVRVDYNPDNQQVRVFELAYALRFIQLRENDSGPNSWSLRQFAVCNKTDIPLSTSTWILVSLPDVAQAQLNKYLEDYRESAAANPFDIHLLLLETVIALWRPYLVHLTEAIAQHSMELMLASPKGDGPFDLTESNMRQQLKQLEDDILDAILCIESTNDTLYLVSRLALRVVEEHSSCAIQEALSEKAKDLDMIHTRLKSLKAKLASTTQVVASFLELGNGYSLEGLAQQAREESIKIGQMTAKSHRDAAAVKALTVITLIYLPVTVVLNLFSASFIDTSTGDMRLVGKWWLFLVAGVPLTVLTLCCWRLWVRIQQLPPHHTWTALLPYDCLRQNRKAKQLKDKDVEMASEPYLHS